MKLVLAMFCSVLLAGTPFLPAQAPCAKQPRHTCGCACCHGGVMPCCAAKGSPASPAAPAVPASSTTQNQISLLAPAVIAWALPAHAIRPLTRSSASPLLAADAPLFARNCARLI
ncbi:MAG: hypothetical protein ABSE16_12390 [Verrucomicrobiota bacterium]